MAEQILTQAASKTDLAAELLTDEQAAALLSVEPRTIRFWRQSRGLPHIKITNKVVRTRRSDLNTWLNRRRVAMVVG